jgi:hypothetical protein
MATIPECSQPVLWGVRRLIDDHGVTRKVDRSVVIAEVDCSGAKGTDWCGRFCPFIDRDEWLDAAASPAPSAVPVAVAPPRYARVKSLAGIQSTLDFVGQRQGLTVMPEMARHTGMRVRVQRTLGKVFEHDRWPQTPALRSMRGGGDGVAAC